MPLTAGREAMLLKTSRVVLPLVAGLILFIARDQWLPEVAYFLIRPDQPVAADIVVALAGDHSGKRAMKAVELVRQGYAPLALLTGAGISYGNEESQMAEAFALANGVEPEIIEPFQIRAFSTLEEAQIVDSELERRGVKTALVVTSDFHTRRARRIYRSVIGSGIEYVFVAAPTNNFDPDVWWRTREGQKTVFYEWTKTVNSWLESPSR